MAGVKCHYGFLMTTTVSELLRNGLELSDILSGDLPCDDLREVPLSMHMLLNTLKKNFGPFSLGVDCFPIDEMNLQLNTKLTFVVHEDVWERFYPCPCSAANRCYDELMTGEKLDKIIENDLFKIHEIVSFSGKKYQVS